jgi:hypothetical protein
MDLVIPTTTNSQSPPTTPVNSNLNIIERKDIPQTETPVGITLQDYLYERRARAMELQPPIGLIDHRIQKLTIKNKQGKQKKEL